MGEIEEIKKENKNNSIYVFIDASNLWQAQKAKGRFLNWEIVKKYIFFLQKIIYLMNLRPEETAM